MTREPVEAIARGAAVHLAREHGPRLVVDVDRALRIDDASRAPAQYGDPTAVGSLIVAAAALAWQVYTDVKARTARPSADEVARTVRVRLDETADLNAAQRDKVIEVVVNETITHGETPG